MGQQLLAAPEYVQDDKYHRVVSWSCEHPDSGHYSEHFGKAFVLASDVATLRALHARLLGVLINIADTLQGGDRLTTIEPWARGLVEKARQAIAAAPDA